LRKTKTNPAITQFCSAGKPDKPRLFVLQPKTGKTHQLRVAMKSLGAPITGDDRYGGTPSDRMYLHAFGLQFAFSGEHYSFEVPPSSGSYFLEQGFTERFEQLIKKTDWR